MTTRAPVSGPRPALPIAGLLAVLPAWLLVGLLLGLVVALGAPAVASETPAPGDTPTSPGSSPSASPGPGLGAEPSVADRVKNARAVFVGTVDSITRPPATASPSPSTGAGSGGAAGSQPTSVILNAEQVYKPRGPRLITTAEVQVQLAAPSAACSGDLQLNERYLVFAASNEGLTARPCDLVPADDATVARVEELTGGSRPAVPVEPEPVSPGLEIVEEAAPASFSRMAAPGVAFVLVGVLGLLGLAVVRRVRR